MPASHARAFVMRDGWGEDSAKICNEMGVTAGHLWALLHRARHWLHAGLVAHR